MSTSATPTRTELTVPSDWPGAVRAGVEWVALGWVSVVIPTLLVALIVTPSVQYSTVSSLASGTNLWLLGLGGARHSEIDGTLSLPLLGLTVYNLWLARSFIRRAQLFNVSAIVVTACTSAGAAFVGSFTAPSSSSFFPAVLFSALLAAVVAAVELGRAGHLDDTRLGKAWARRPLWLGLGLRLAGFELLTLATAALVVLALALVTGFSRISTLHDSLVGAGTVATVSLLTLQILWLPTAAIWALSWLAGPGFVLGQGSLFSPGVVRAGSVPALPMLGALPKTAFGSAWIIIVVLILGLTLVTWLAIGRKVAANSKLISLRATLALGATAIITSSLVILLLCLAASGSVGPGRMSVAGPRTLAVVGALAAQLFAATLLGLVLPHPRVRLGASQTKHKIEVVSMSASKAAARSGNEPKRLVVLASGSGSNLLAILKACQDPTYGAKVVAVGADKTCKALDYAAQYKVPSFVVPLKDYPSRASWDQALTDAVAKYQPDLVVCAGFMKLVGESFLAEFGGKTINTHPALLPKYPGAHAVRDALADGATVSGATLFWVDAGVDTGKIIAQVQVPVKPGDTHESLTERIKAAETPQLVAELGKLVRS